MFNVFCLVTFGATTDSNSNEFFVYLGEMSCFLIYEGSHPTCSSQPDCFKKGQLYGLVAMSKQRSL